MQMFTGRISTGMTASSYAIAIAATLAAASAAQAEENITLDAIANSSQAAAQMRAQRQAPIAAPVRAIRTQRPAAGPAEGFILTLSDRVVGGKVVVSGDSEAVKQSAIRNNAAQERAGRQLRAAGLREIKPIRGSRFVAVSGTVQQMQQLQRSGVISAFEKNQLLTPLLQHSVPLINPPQIWNTFNRGQGQEVAIIDTGVQSTHEFLAGRLSSEACFTTTSATMGTTATCTSGSTAPGAGAPCTMANCWHGTHVAGIAVGRATGLTAQNGVAPESRYVSIQVASEYDGGPAALTSDTLAAFYHVRDLKASGRHIASANYSMGGQLVSGPCGGPLETVFQQLRALQVAPVTSSGNTGEQGSVTYPACAPSAITVAGTTKQDAMGSYSNLSPQVDMLAPGSNIVSSSSHPTYNYQGATGTSMAAPHVAGSFALLRQIYHCYSINQLETALENNGVMIAGPGSTGSFPRIDLAATYSSLGQFRWGHCRISKEGMMKAQPALKAKPL